MKIGILTFHHGYNFGGFMQVFSLQETLKELGYEVEIINYQNKTHFYRKHKNLIKKDVKLTLTNFKKANHFRKMHKLLNTGKFTFGRNLAQTEYDFLIVGSDEVWNFNNPMFGKDLAYFGVGINAKKKISYAASFGAIQEAQIVDNQDVQEALLGFDAISVRDSNSRRIIEKVRETPELVWDPTFLIDLNHCVKDYESDSPYILVYVGGKLEPDFRDYIIDFSRKEGLKLVSVGYNHDFCDEYVMDLGPFEWLGVINKAEFVFTSMFHGTIFSILLKKQFLTSVTEYRKNKFNPMIEKLGLQSRIYSETSVMNKEIDYHEVFEIIDRGKQESLEFFKKNLK